jgi:ribosome-binding factor A
VNERMLRVNSILRHVLAEEIERLTDTRLEMVTVTGVDTSPDLRHAVIYVDVLDPDDRQPALDALRRAANRLQMAVGREVRFKYTPALEFRMDPAIVSASRIESILKELGEEEE